MAEIRASQKANSHRVFGHIREQAKIFGVGLYGRVSTGDQHTLPMLRRPLREHDARRGWAIVLQIREVGSGVERREALRLHGIVTKLVAGRGGNSGISYSPV